MRSEPPRAAARRLHSLSDADPEERPRPARWIIQVRRRALVELQGETFMSTRCTRLDTLVERLHMIGGDEPGTDDVSEILSSADIEDRSLMEFVNFRRDKYTRNLVRRTELFDVIVLCWQPGQMTPIHNHSGQRGWVRVLRGQMEETAFSTLGPEPPPWATEVDIPLEATGTTLVEARSRGRCRGSEPRHPSLGKSASGERR